MLGCAVCSPTAPCLLHLKASALLPYCFLRLVVPPPCMLPPWAIQGNTSHLLYSPQEFVLLLCLSVTGHCLVFWLWHSESFACFSGSLSFHTLMCGTNLRFGWGGMETRKSPTSSLCCDAHSFPMITFMLVSCILKLRLYRR